MRYLLIVILFIGILGNCSGKDDDPQIYNNQLPANQTTDIGCPGVVYHPWQSSSYVLPYPVGETYQVHLSQCSGSYHSKGQPDQFAVDFGMDIGTLITASRDGTVVHVVENGIDGEFPNNLVVVRHSDDTYAQYMHLTQYGAIPEEGEFVSRGDSIGFSGATGLAGYPHLHFVVTRDQWEYPYESIPYNFKNTTANPRGPESRKYYTAKPY